MSGKDNQINPDGWYSERDVLLRLGIGYESQARARAAGKLRFVQRESSYIYRGSWLLDYLGDEPDAPADSAAKRARIAGSNAMPVAY